MHRKSLIVVSEKPLVVKGLVNRYHIEKAILKGLDSCKILSPLCWLVSADNVFYIGYSADITDEIVAATPIRARFVSSAVLSYFDEFTPKRRFRKKSFVMKEVVDTVDNLSRLFTPVLSFDLTD